MATAKTWIWIIVGFIGVCLVSLMAMAGAGVYFVRQHIQIEASSDTRSEQAFATARAAFKNQTPLLELDNLGHAHQTRQLSDLPTSAVKPADLVVMVWQQDKERLVHVTMPFWLLKLGRRKIDLANGDNGLDFDRLNLDIGELERVGPILVMDLRRPTGERVLVWTQ